MKRIAYIFILISCLGVKNIYAESNQTFTFHDFPSLNKSDKTFSKKSSYYTIDSGDSDHSPFTKKKKKRKRGIKPALICVTNELHFIIISFEIDLVCSPQTFYFFRPYFINGERAPPFPAVV